MNKFFKNVLFYLLIIIVMIWMFDFYGEKNAKPSEISYSSFLQHVQQDEIKQVDASRFIALVKKYRDCKELTDTMLYAFIDRIEVHEATCGRTIYRQQNIDIHFNFIGNYYPPVETVSEEERIAAIEAEQLRKKQSQEIL